MKTVSFTLGRPLGAGLLLAGLVLAALGAVAAGWADLQSAREERDAQAELLQRSVAAGRLPRAAPAAAADPFVPGETATLAAAAVDAGLRALAASSGLTLLSSRADAEPDEGAPPAGGGIGTRIEDQAVVEGANEGLQSLLIKLETGTPAMLVDDLALEPAEAAEGAVADPQAPRLRLSLTLSAYWRPPPRAAGR